MLISLMGTSAEFKVCSEKEKFFSSRCFCQFRHDLQSSIHRENKKAVMFLQP